ncbi:hypothetical protein D3C80_769640 [compost metagenome]
MQRSGLRPCRHQADPDHGRVQLAQLLIVAGVGKHTWVDAQRFASGKLQRVDQPLQRFAEGVGLATGATLARGLAVDQRQ